MAKSRYNNLAVVKDPKTNKSRIGLSPSLTAIEMSDNTDIIVTTQEGDSLDFLAHTHLGNGRYWWMIAYLNDIHLPLGDFIKAGQLIRIPTNTDKFFSVILQKRDEK